MAYICSRCGTPAYPGSHFCGSCGGSIIYQNDPQGRFCENCGTPLSPTDTFCPSCGMNSNNKKSNSSTAVIIIAAIAVILAGIAAAFITMNLYSGNSKQELPTHTSTATKMPAPTEEPTAEQPANPSFRQDAPPPAGGPGGPPPGDMGRGAPPPVSGGGTYSYPSDSQLISTSYLNGLSRSQVRLVLNEIYARHGYTFSDSYYSAYFNSQPWYVSMGKSMNQCSSEFNYYEKNNVETITAYEQSRGWR